eukprot:gene29187-53209_t
MIPGYIRLAAIVHQPEGRGHFLAQVPTLTGYAAVNSLGPSVVPITQAEWDAQHASKHWVWAPTAAAVRKLDKRALQDMALGLTGPQGRGTGLPAAWIQQATAEQLQHELVSRHEQLFPLQGLQAEFAAVADPPRGTDAGQGAAAATLSAAGSCALPLVLSRIKRLRECYSKEHAFPAWVREDHPAILDLPWDSVEFIYVRNKDEPAVAAPMEVQRVLLERQPTNIAMEKRYDEAKFLGAFGLADMAAYCSTPVAPEACTGSPDAATRGMFTEAGTGLRASQHMGKMAHILSAALDAAVAIVREFGKGLTWHQRKLWLRPLLRREPEQQLHHQRCTRLQRLPPLRHRVASGDPAAAEQLVAALLKGDRNVLLRHINDPQQFHILVQQAHACLAQPQGPEKEAQAMEEDAAPPPAAALGTGMGLHLPRRRHLQRQLQGHQRHRLRWIGHQPPVMAETVETFLLVGPKLHPQRRPRAMAPKDNPPLRQQPQGRSCRRIAPDLDTDSRARLLRQGFPGSGPPSESKEEAAPVPPAAGEDAAAAAAAKSEPGREDSAAVEAVGEGAGRDGWQPEKGMRVLVQLRSADIGGGVSSPTIGETVWLTGSVEQLSAATGDQ